MIEKILPRKSYFILFVCLFSVLCVLYSNDILTSDFNGNRKIKPHQLTKLKSSSNNHIEIISSKSNNHKVISSKTYNSLCAFKGKNGVSVCDERDDKLMGKIIKNSYLDRPSKEEYSFRKKPPDLDGQIGVPKIIDDLLGNKNNGFYIESGGYNGEEWSNSLFFELKRNYRGLLVEPNKDNYKKLLGVHRKAFSVNACYSTSLSGLPMLVDFVNAKDLGAIKKYSPKLNHFQKEKYQGDSKAICLSFYSILLAVGNPVVDYLSLDIEGAELPVLQSIPWGMVDIKVLSIECGQMPRCEKIKEFMWRVGYKFIRYVPSKDNPQDIIMKKK